jgi:hypothetical protein
VTGLPGCSGTADVAREGLTEFELDALLDDAFNLLTAFDVRGVDED